ncbi:MAG: glutathione S-transferase family protein [Marinicaulis sp.]|nr:glutathione S-transferase family protein [Marinicaulis sp.]NNL89220.1 glutathione S-transferase family protein [Marinicaulis sp.]
MRTLFHMRTDPACRFIRLVLAEKGLPAQQVEKAIWNDEDGALIAANPSGEIPVLVDEPPTGGQISIAPAIPIAEYLEDAYSTTVLMPSTSAARAEARRLCAWMLGKFEREVSQNIVAEKIDKRMMRRGQPDYELLKVGIEALDWHLDYFSWLFDQRTWIAGETMTLADFSAAAYLSSLDYVDAVPWEKYASVKDWYAKIKSRPSFRPILNDRVDGLPPPAHYNDLDF